MSDKTLLDLVVTGLVESEVFAFETEAGEAVEAEMSGSLKATLEMIGYNIPVYSNSIRFFMATEDDSDIEGETDVRET